MVVQSLRTHDYSAIEISAAVKIEVNHYVSIGARFMFANFKALRCHSSHVDLGNGSDE